ncbi:MAG: hypothetical protein A3G07_01645 [Candidatus Doudnabacteria bacterium RIFCSPLOWO2_12_FULL_47_12]|nr:MAG: hypothetical protein A3G07_01645 [Candidatus Doudnabacteria bacterium RIFCSPLOWO2_12_FULL_47_12]
MIKPKAYFQTYRPYKSAKTGAGFILIELPSLRHSPSRRSFGAVGRLRRAHAFTLVELLVVISVIGLLASVILVSLNSARAKARDAKRKSDLRQMVNALELYFNVNDRYPGYNDLGTSSGAISCEGNWNTLQTALSLYMNSLPRDPQNICDWASGRFYKYHYKPYLSAQPTGYEIAASLENTSDLTTGDFLYNCAVPPESCIYRKAAGGWGFSK